MNQAAKARMLCAILIGGMLAAVLYHGVERFVLHAGYPRATFLFRPGVRFSDFGDVFAPVKAGSPLASPLAVYFPFAYAPLFLLAPLSPPRALVAVLALFSAGVFVFFRGRLASLPGGARLVAAGTIAFVSYPFLFCLDRANLEMLLLLLMAGFVLCVERGRHLPAAVLLAAATAMKLYPGAFGVILLYRRRYAAAALVAVLTAALTLGSAAAYPGGVSGSFALLGRNLVLFREHFVLGAESVPFSAGYLSVVKLIVLRTAADPAAAIAAVHGGYVAASVALFALGTAFILRFPVALWKQVAILACLTILLPEVSFDYKLVHLLPPLGLFLAAPPEDAGGDRVYTALFGLLLIPKAYGLLGDGEITAGVVLNPLLMTLLVARIVWSRLRAPAGSAAALPA